MARKIKPLTEMSHYDLHDGIHQNQTDIEIMKHDVNNIKEDVKEVKDDIRRVENKVDKHQDHVHNKMDKLDNRLWWIVGIALSGVLIPIIRGMFGS